MAEFVCKVGDPSGRIFQQVETAQSAAEAKQKLAERGLYVYSVRTDLGLLSALGRRRKSTVRASDFQIFNQQFNTLVKAGIPILKSLELLADRAASVRLKPILADVRERVRGGALLSEAFEATGMFPKVYCTALLAGEKSGNLSGVLDDYLAYQKVTSGVRKKLIAVLIYPAILMTVGSIILTYLFTYVVPQFAKLYSEMNVQLPGPTKLLTTLVVDYRGWILASAALTVLAIGLAFLWSRTEKGGVALDRWKLKLPLVGDTWIKFHVGQFSRTLATLLAGGTPLVPALETSADALGTKLVASSVQNASVRVREGESLHTSLAATGLMPSLALDMIEVGEASGALAPMLNSVAQFYEDETSLRISALLSVIEPAILLVMAFLIAFVLIALYLPLFSFSVSSGAV